MFDKDYHKESNSFITYHSLPSVDGAKNGEEVQHQNICSQVIIQEPLNINGEYLLKEVYIDVARLRTIMKAIDDISEKRFMATHCESPF